MTKLIVRPIDSGAPGSYRERREYRRITKRLNESGRTQDIVEQIAALDEADDWIISRLRTDDGTPVEDVLKEISGDDFDTLWTAAGTGDTAVPPENASS